MLSKSALIAHERNRTTLMLLLIALLPRSLVVALLKEKMNCCSPTLSPVVLKKAGWAQPNEKPGCISGDKIAADKYGSCQLFTFPHLPLEMASTIVAGRICTKDQASLQQNSNSSTEQCL